MDYYNDFNAAYHEKWICRQQEKAAIKRSANAIGFAYIGVVIIAVFWARALAFVLGKLGVSRFDFYSALQDPAVLQYAQIVIPLIMFMVPAMILIIWSREPISQVTALNKPKKGTFFPLILIGMGFCSFANIVNTLCGQIFLELGFPDTSVEMKFPAGFFGFLLVFFSIAIMPALVEEFAMRGVIMGHLRRYGDNVAIIASSILFGLIHANFEQILFAFIVGLVLAFVAVKSGSLWTAAFVHFFNNLISIILSYAFEDASEVAANATYLVFLAVTLLLTIVGLYIYTKRDPDALSMPAKNNFSTTGEKLKWFFTSPVIIIAIIVTAIETIFLH